MFRATVSSVVTKTHPFLRDQETRQRLLEAAARLFAEDGFKNVTVRDICQAVGANVAAVNYYFRDKLGLYTEVVRLIADRMRSTKQDAMDAGEGRPPQEQLRRYIQTFLHRLLSGNEESWMDKLIGRELAEPTPALDLIIEHGIKPNAVRLGGLMSQLLGCSAEDERVWQCACCIQAQCLFFRSSEPVFARLAPGFKFTPEVIDRLAEHIAEFSLAGIRAIAQRDARVKV
jgi:TetR/AcrR family transcriptional regulator, regulator of cefoperazone and chloramphenicol sensitivity